MFHIGNILFPLKKQFVSALETNCFKLWDNQEHIDNERNRLKYVHLYVKKAEKSVGMKKKV